MFIRAVKVWKFVFYNYYIYQFVLITLVLLYSFQIGDSYLAVCGLPGKSMKFLHRRMALS